jgi:tRNA nucleotidyltransferase (CCA-adding enzyme)
MRSVSAVKSGLQPKRSKQKLERILKRVISDFRPTPSEQKMLVLYSNMLMARLKAIVPKNVEIIWVGSTARGTQLRGSSDIDIFLLFPKAMSKELVKKKGMEYAKKIVNKKKNESYVIKYAEHPYLKLILRDIGMTADIVPAFKIRDAGERVTSVDRTQLHNEFITKRLGASQKDNVIALKVFLKSRGIYGAGARYEGFSGYLCELLIYQYGSFLKVIESMAALKLPIVIDPLSRTARVGALPQVAEAVKKFKKSFVVIDPVDRNRNVAAVVADESLGRFITISKMLLENPSLEFFYGPKYSDTYSRQRIEKMRRGLGLDVYLLAFKPPDITEEIIWQQVRRFRNYIANTLKKDGFPPILALENVSEKDAIMAFFVSGVALKHKISEGPNVFMGNAVSRFLKSHTESLGVFFDKDRIYVLEDSTFNNPKEVIENAMRKIQNAPPYMSRKKTIIYVNAMPERLAKLLYAAFVKKTSL